MDYDEQLADEAHLGGYGYNGDPATTYPNMWKFLTKDKKIKSIIELGCARGQVLKIFNDLGCKVLGIEGCTKAIKENLLPNRVRQYDFTKVKVIPQKNYDLGIAIEFVEHVEDYYKENYLSCFDACRYVAITFAKPGQGGHHHVNCQPEEYWIDIFEKRGFTYDYEYTNILKDKAMTDRFEYCPTFDGNHFEHRGLFFRKK